ncbi:MFS transporter [Micromonospora sp. NPDC049559]|uniref:MFS transporter n=1 Tax=Micromonospora sp. NPDC049559 TaxID=3155923 RepID=UPI003437A77C
MILTTAAEAPTERPSRAAHAGYLAGMFVDALGSGLYLPFTLVFIRAVTDLPVQTVGLGLTVAALAGLAANPLAGVAADRFGARQVLIASYLLRVIGFACYPLVHGFAMFVVVAAVVSAGDRSFYPANSAYVADHARGAARDRLYALVGTGRNVGLGIGGLLAAGAVQFAGDSGYRLIAVLNAASFLVAAVLLAATGRSGHANRALVRQRPRDLFAGYGRVFRDPAFRRLTLAELAFTGAHSVIPIAIPLYATVVLHAPAGLLGLLFTLNTILVAAGQLPVLRWQRRARRTHAMALAGLVFVVSFGAFALAAALPAGPARAVGLALAVVLCTLGELLHARPSASLAAALAPEAYRGRYLAVYQLTWAVSAVATPGAFAGLVAFDARLLWLIVAVVTAVASVALLRLARRMPPAVQHA